MRVRLPLLSTALASSRASATAPRGARRIVSAALAVADTVSPERAAQFAAQVAVELAAAGAPIRYCLLDYEETPALSRALADRLAAAQVAVSAHRSSALDGELAPPLRDPEAAYSLLVGAPAVGSYAAPITVLTGTGRPLREWPAWLVRARGAVSLELPGAPEAVARALARALFAARARGFLPRER